MYSSYTADSFARAYELADRHGVNLEGELTWAFEFEDQPFFAGFRALASNGLDLPVLNVFRMFSKMSGQRVSTQSSGGLTLDEILDKGVRDRPDVSALASIDNHKCAVMVWHYADDDIEGPPAAIDLKVDRLPVQHGTVMVDEYRIDEQHSNAFTTWQKMGSPQQPSLAEYKKLEAAGQLQQSETQQKLKVEDGVVQVKAVLPRKAISLFILSWH
jgi:xylan 1,4-beta-xylosidase